MKQQRTHEDQELALQLATLTATVEALRTDIKRLEDNSITKQEFSPVRMVAYGAVGLIMSAVIGGIISYFVRKT